MLENDPLKAIAEKYLARSISDPSAHFREGQWEAIDAVTNERKKLIVVQRTGWGKSSVYFISTRILRDRGAGPTIIVSPLLALMRNQIEAAERLGINAVTINSTNQNDWNSIINDIKSNRIDAVLISPERLSNQDFVASVLNPIAEHIGLLVVDEAHCISDWGHDFRPDYRRLVNILKQMPPNMPVIGTTATANNRVVEDIQSQLGDITIQRGTLIRETLALQNIKLPDQATRLAWLSTNIPKIPGTGIVYALTVRDAEQVTAWLISQGINAKAYHSGAEHEDFIDSDSYRQYLESLLLSNQIKVLVATTALGMGYDKPDLGFVIHYQAPGSIVGYYQQVGRAGRGIDHAYGVLLAGNEDEEIHHFFRETAFPREQDVNEILAVLNSSDGLSLYGMEEHLNMRHGQIEKAVKVLSVETPAPLIKHGSKWYRTPVAFHLDHDRIERLTRQREVEWKEITNYVEAKTCLMSFLRSALDDPSPAPCRKCSNCTESQLFDHNVEHSLVTEAKRFLRHSEVIFKPKKQMAKDAFKIYGFKTNIPKELQAQEGRILSRWGDAGWGAVVADDKHSGKFREELVEAIAEMYLERWNPNPMPQWITCVPSKNHPNLVPDFAKKLADRLGLPFVEAIEKIGDNQPQKLQQNRFHQCKNLDGVFSIRQNIPKLPVLLVDDVVDSGWTLTVLAALLQSRGSGIVYPVALATSANSG